jgi:hypothetical protein
LFDLLFFLTAPNGFLSEGKNQKKEASEITKSERSSGVDRRGGGV